MTSARNQFQQLIKGLTGKIILAMLLGAVVGVLVRNLPLAQTVKHQIAHNGFDILGKIFINLLRMLVVPIVFVSLVRGTGALNDAHQLGRVGFKTVALYLITTAAAIALALMLAYLFQVGAGVQLDAPTNFSTEQAPSLRQVLINIFPSNPVKAFAEGHMLQIIVFSLFFGGACLTTGEYGQRVLNAFESVHHVLMRLIMIIMQLAPYGVFCLLASVFITEGFELIIKLVMYFIVVILTLALHFFGTYSLLLFMLGRLNPIHFLRKIYQPMLFAFSVASSSASIPVVWENARDRMGVSNFIASFNIPLGATINMDGTSIMQGVATVFIAQVYQIDIGLTGYLTVILMAVLASIGTAGVPSVGLITLSMVLKQVGLPVEGVALIIGVDRLLDMARTAVNIAGDTAIACIVSKSENSLDQSQYQSP